MVEPGKAAMAFVLRNNPPGRSTVVSLNLIFNKAIIRKLCFALSLLAPLLAQRRMDISIGQQMQGEMVDLGSWRMQVGDDASWSQPDFDDSSWATLPRLVNISDILQTRSNPVTWYRTALSVPAWWNGKNLAIGVWKLDDAYEVFVNGVKVGGFGSMPAAGSGSGDEAVTAFSFRPRFFAISPDLTSGSEVHIAIRRWQLRVTNGFEVHEFSPLRNIPPSIGLAGTVMQARELLSLRQLVAGMPGLVCWFVTFCCGLLCVGLWREGDGREFLWLGLGLIAAGFTWALSVPVGLSDQFPKTSLLVFAATVVGAVAPLILFGWFLGELIPYWKGAVRWASVLIALGISFYYANSYFPFADPSFVSTIRKASFSAELAICLAALWVAWWSGKEGLIAPILGITARAVVYLGSSFYNAFNYYSAGPFLFSLRRTSDAVIAVALVAILYARMRRERARQLATAQDLAAARRVQEMLLGSEDAPTPGFDVETAYQPAREVGGDFFQVLPGEDGSLLLLVGDVSGKGLQAAMLVSSIIGALRNESSRAPGEVLAHLNRSLAGRTGGGFVTCCCARFEHDGSVRLANAGHLAPYADGIEAAVEAGLPLGIAEDMEYAESVVSGTSFTFVSDGVVEAENAKRELFGFDRTREISGKSAQEIAEAAKAWGQNDDITVVTVRRSKC